MIPNRQWECSASQKSSAGKSSWLRKDEANPEPLHLFMRERRFFVSMLRGKHGIVYDVETRRKGISVDEARRSHETNHQGH
jgi:hypothetical protein